MSFKNFLRPRLCARNKLIILNFHQVSERAGPKQSGSGTWTAREYFQDQLLRLRDQFRISRLDSCLGKLQKNSLKGTHVAITVDDGDISLAETIVPILESEDIPATFFLNSAYMGTAKAAWTCARLHQDEIDALAGDFDSVEMLNRLRSTRDGSFYEKFRLRIEKALSQRLQGTTHYVDREFVRSLNPELFQVGLHGHEHQRHSMYGEAWQRRNIERNIEALSNFDNYVPVFAVPFGRPLDWNETTIKVCRELAVQPLFANGGYNTNRNYGGRRIPADSRDLMHLINSLSPFINRYDPPVAWH